MEEVEGIPGALPRLVDFPPTSLRTNLPPEEWQICLDAWIVGIEIRLRLHSDHFRRLKLSDTASGFSFLLSYCEEQALQNLAGHTQTSDRDLALHRHCLVLARRLLLGTDSPWDSPPQKLLSLLANGSTVFETGSLWNQLMVQCWEKSPKTITVAITISKSTLTKYLPQIATGSAEAKSCLIQAVALTKAMPEQAGPVYMAGSDCLEALYQSYTEITSVQDEVSAKQVTEFLYLCLTSLTAVEPPRLSTLLDDLYMLKSLDDKKQLSLSERGSILSSLICTTKFLHLLSGNLQSNRRGRTLLQTLQTYKLNMQMIHHVPVGQRAQKRKGKGRASEIQDMNRRFTPQTSQVHELFPELPQMYVVELLHYYNNSVEEATAALLEPSSLPPHLSSPAASTEEVHATEMASETAPPVNANFKDSAHSNTPATLSSRRNVFDGDDFDNLRLSSSKLSIGKTKLEVQPQEATERTKNKAAIIAALAAFDSDDDERDDTYDVADVGGTIDSTLDTDERSKGPKPPTVNTEAHEQLLFRAWKTTPEVFARDSNTRISQPRRKLKAETGMTDEQIEGFAVMLGRDDANRSRQEKKYSSASRFGGTQHSLASTRWQANSGTATEEDESADEGPSSSSRGGFQARGRGSRGSRGSTTGQTHDPSTQAARRRKEQGRGRGGANHNRREGRAKKIGSGMAGPPP